MLTAAGADDLCDYVFREAGNNYGDALRRCIKGIDHPESHLGNADFHYMFREGVLRPLARNLDAFSMGVQ